MKKPSRGDADLLQLSAHRDASGSVDVNFAARGRVAVGMLAAIVVVAAVIVFFVSKWLK